MLFEQLIVTILYLDKPNYPKIYTDSPCCSLFFPNFYLYFWLKGTWSLNTLFYGFCYIQNHYFSAHDFCFFKTFIPTLFLLFVEAIYLQLSLREICWLARKESIQTK